MEEENEWNPSYFEYQKPSIISIFPYIFFSGTNLISLADGCVGPTGVKVMNSKKSKEKFTFLIFKILPIYIFLYSFFFYH